MNKPVTTPTAIAASASDAERALRIDLAAAYRLAHHFQMDDLIYTHFSARLPGGGDMLLNPYGLLFEEITASSLIRVSKTGEMVGTSDYELNYFGYKIHEPIYRFKPSIGSVMHTHTRAAIAVSCLEQGLMPLSQMSLFYYRQVGYHAYEGNYFKADEQRRLADCLGQHKAVFLRNHGLLVVGETVAECFSRLYYLEQCCRIQVDALACGGKPVTIGEAVAEPMIAQYWKLGMPFSQREWPALLRRLDRLAAGIRRLGVRPLLLCNQSNYINRITTLNYCFWQIRERTKCMRVDLAAITRIVNSIT